MASEEELSNGQKPKYIANRVIGVFILIVIFASLWLYGYGSEIRRINNATLPVTLNSQPIYGNLLILEGLFTVVGFGLLLSYFKKSSFSGLFISVTTVSLTVLLCPLFSKFWFNTFLADFHGQTPADTSSPARFINRSMGGLEVYLDYYNLRITMACAISQLVVLLALHGRMKWLDLGLNWFFFNLFWTFNHFLCLLLQAQAPDNRIWDDYAINNVYIFAACYGLIMAFMLRKAPTASTQTFSSSTSTSVLAILGIFFLFFTFCITTTLYGPKYTTLLTSELARTAIWQQAFISCFFALSASVIFTYTLSILLAQKISIREAIIGTLSGGIVYGTVACTNVNISVAIVSGLVGGALSVLCFKFIFLKINSDNITDTYGVIAIAAFSLFSTFFITPIVIRALYNNDVNLPTLQDSNQNSTMISNKDAAGWMLTYLGVSTALGLISGLLVGLILRAIGKAQARWFDDREWFHKNYGYLTKHQRDIQQDRKEELAQSAANLNREQELNKEEGQPV